MKQETETLTNWEDSEQQQQLIEALRTRQVTVDFNKVNGEFRSMTCTLSEDLIPVDKYPKTEDESVTKKKISNQALRVFDINKQEWRSFRWSNIVDVTF